MATHHHEPVVVDEKYTLTSGTRRTLFLTIAIGLVAVVLGFVLMSLSGGHDEHGTAAHGTESATEAVTGGDVPPNLGETAIDPSAEAAPAEHGAHEAAAAHEGGAHHEFHWYDRLWANVWLNNVYFAGLAIIGVFFLTIQYVALAGWSIVLQRIMSAMSAWVPIAGVIMLLAFVFGHHSIFEWTHEDVVAHDEILQGKSGYLNIPFFLIRLVVFFGVWTFMYLRLRKASSEEDLHGTTQYYKRSLRLSAIFLVFFAVSESMAAWDWTMSVQPHWYSTLWGWYNFASWFVAGLSTITLAAILLKEQGYLKAITANHLHDMGKFIFGFSIFWTYLWFAQFLLIYYANIPEETIFFVERMQGFDGQFRGLFFLNLIVNFFFPFLVLMTRDSKRQMIILKVVTCVLIVGHWLDFYLMMMPAVLRQNASFGLVEFGMVAVFAGAFILVFATSLSKLNLLPKHHPMLEESLHHEV
ncbi:hypothetical protein SAMN05421823_102619 [Catalinimonas alkaloidigena]|uniref:Quinol:cytochrome c oxidoreductase quinone-binding subunit 2 n=1 Tax=Catalinimonas alkaloidigena TaxID=1075417 RepID=A0A1G9BHP9_9BACT|nr:quinol:cytochrome C oxidoreductase [Catalinimonas alkaloidigena]SDK39022.1 hypothetical protein SAMN05421823_102619 [Catalinimonas alkaloidigena]